MCKFASHHCLGPELRTAPGPGLIGIVLGESTLAPFEMLSRHFMTTRLLIKISSQLYQLSKSELGQIGRNLGRVFNSRLTCAAHSTNEA
jgi:hypothetical protein